MLTTAKLLRESPRDHKKFGLKHRSMAIQITRTPSHDDDMTCPVAPKLDFGGTTPYEDYVHASVLHSLQQQWSEDPREMSFLVITQVMELYFGLLCFEWRQAKK